MFRLETPSRAFFLLRAGSLPAAGQTLALGAVEAMRSHRTHAKPAAERLGAVKLLKARSPFHSVLFALPREKLFKRTSLKHRPSFGQHTLY